VDFQEQALDDIGEGCHDDIGHFGLASYLPVPSDEATPPLRPDLINGEGCHNGVGLFSLVSNVLPIPIK
jgi:hypothetical protein